MDQRADRLNYGLHSKRSQSITILFGGKGALSAYGLLFTVSSRIGFGAILIDSAGQIEAYNSVAEHQLNSFSNKTAKKKLGIRSTIKGLLGSSINRFRLNSESWVVIPQERGRPLALHALPAGDSDDPYSKTLIVLIDLNEYRSPSVEALQNLFNLTQSESDIAIMLSRGKTPSEIANERRISLWTVRTQLASIFSKTQTRRQADLVALMSKIAMLS